MQLFCEKSGQELLGVEVSGHAWVVLELLGCCQWSLTWLGHDFHSFVSFRKIPQAAWWPSDLGTFLVVFVAQLKSSLKCLLFHEITGRSVFENIEKMVTCIPILDRSLCKNVQLIFLVWMTCIALCIPLTLYFIYLFLPLWKSNKFTF